MNQGFPDLKTNGTSNALMWSARTETKKTTTSRFSITEKIKINNITVIAYFPSSAFKALAIPVACFSRGKELIARVYKPGIATTTIAKSTANAAPTLVKNKGTIAINAMKHWIWRTLNNGLLLFARTPTLSITSPQFFTQSIVIKA